LDTHGTEDFLGRQRRQGLSATVTPADPALILMGDWCSRGLTLNQKRNYGKGREADSASWPQSHDQGREKKKSRKGVLFFS
jgi:hypothetical protein